ncbi:hypothetical protein Scep_028062 [Stephania cephalantha]|uniref:Uncharacterized protein n=1 Tax=Stephania cephalantha TaxID=152367 RepID=A0AAP0HN46_9MAGN
MVDQPDIGDHIGEAAPRYINVSDFLELTRRFEFQDHRDTSAPTFQATSLPPTSKVLATPVIVAVPMLPESATPVVVAQIESDTSLDLTHKAGLTRDYERYKLKKFSGDFDVLEA